MVFPLLLMILFVTIEFSYMFYVRHSLSNAAREGARAAILPDATSADVTSAITTAVANSGFSNLTYTAQMKSGGTVLSDPSALSSGTSVEVELTAPWSQFSLLKTDWSVWSDDITSTAVMRREG